ncbi:MAG TPA: o-succinylbenzoate synthase, partial [Actinomycetota bacterium]|nr:o-succinylbenzoate synthase [Actinomycetota bacterium]
MKIEAIELFRIRLPLVAPFRTSFGTISEKDAILVRAESTGGVEGWGECVAAEVPSYSAEWNDGAWILLRELLAPAALAGRRAAVRGHPMAKAALEIAL